MKTLLIGIDISKDTLDVVGLDLQGKTCHQPQSHSNTLDGIAGFLEAVEGGFNDWKVWVCVEDTGVYGALLLSMLSAHQITVSVLNPLELIYSMGLVRGKTDSVDAMRIARYGVRHYDELLVYAYPHQTLRKLKALMSVRMRLVKVRTNLKNGLGALKKLGETTDLSSAIAQEESLIKELDTRIFTYEREMISLVRATDELNKNYKKIIKVIGVGPITAMLSLIYTANFTRFENAREFNCYCGLAPFKHQSGVSVKKRTKTSKLRSKPMKAILMQAAATAIQYDPQLKAYYHRKEKEGKAKLSVLNAVANKLVLRIFAVQRREEPFVKLCA